jgi:hypothetical protein
MSAACRLHVGCMSAACRLHVGCMSPIPHAVYPTPCFSLCWYTAVQPAGHPLDTRRLRTLADSSRPPELATRHVTLLWDECDSSAATPSLRTGEFYKVACMAPAWRLHCACTQLAPDSGGQLSTTRIGSRSNELSPACACMSPVQQVSIFMRRVVTECSTSRQPAWGRYICSASQAVCGSLLISTYAIFSFRFQSMFCIHVLYCI